MITVTVHNQNPHALLRVHHSGYEQALGHWVNIRVRNEWSRCLSLQTPWQPGPIVTGRGLEALERMDWWNCRMHESGVYIVDGKLDSNTGYHSAMFRVSDDLVYDVLFYNPNLFFSEFFQIDNYKEGHPYVAWRYQKRVHAVLVLKVRDSFAPNFTVEIESDSEPMTQGHLTATYVSDYHPPEGLLKYKKDFKIYNHTFQGWIQVLSMFDRCNQRKIVLAYLPFVTTVTATDHDEMSLGPGLWLCEHPRPGKDVD